VREVLEILENIIAEAGDLIESRSPELAAQARAALRAMPMKLPAKPNDAGAASTPLFSAPNSDTNLNRSNVIQTRVKPPWEVSDEIPA
jgi:hypothetical protein